MSFGSKPNNQYRTLQPTQKMQSNTENHYNQHITQQPIQNTMYIVQPIQNPTTNTLQSNTKQCKAPTKHGEQALRYKTKTEE